MMDVYFYVSLKANSHTDIYLRPSFSDSLNLANNHFVGQIPPEWTQMASLQELDVSSNSLEGPIPMYVDGMVR